MGTLRMGTLRVVRRVTISPWLRPGVGAPAERHPINQSRTRGSTASDAARETAPARRGLIILIGAFLIAGALRQSVGANEEEDAKLDNSSEVIAYLERGRAVKDSLLRDGSDSPLRPVDRANFEGLGYFPVDLKFRMVGDLHRYGRQRRVLVPTTGDTLVYMDRFGRLLLQLEGNEFWLEVYANPSAGDLSVFFTDSTNGHQTYGGGRYAPVHELGAGVYLIDFNEAYNPYCAYNTDYICPLPPAHNRLSAAVTAGEKSYGPDLAPH